MNQFKATLKPVVQARAVFKRCLDAGNQSLQKATDMRLALGPNPSVPAQQAVFDEYWHAANILHAGIIMSAMDTCEAIEDAGNAIANFAAGLTPRTPIERADQHVLYATLRRCLERREEKVEAEAEAYRERCEANGLLLKAALPDFDTVAPHYEIVMEPSIL
jgi:hypothetical protein